MSGKAYALIDLCFLATQPIKVKPLFPHYCVYSRKEVLALKSENITFHTYSIFFEKKKKKKYIYIIYYYFLFFQRIYY